VGLYINEDKTKYKHIKRANRRNILLQINNFFFEKVFNFIHLGSLLNDGKLRQPEISERICKGNRAYYAYAKHLRSKFLKRNIKMKIYLNLIRPVVISASQTWTLNEDKNGLRICERQFLWKIFGPLWTGMQCWTRTFSSCSRHRMIKELKRSDTYIERTSQVRLK